MITNPIATTKALFQSLVKSPLLIGNLPEASTLGQRDLESPESSPSLNFQQKLGHLYEDALAQLLKTSPRFELLEQSLQIQLDRHTTVGELDYLIRDRTSGQIIHLELATKFYLALETETGLALPGPDARDSYYNKLTRLREHQLQLPTLFKANLPVKFRDESIVTKQLIYGCLFDHIDASKPACPEFINPQCRRGKWLHLDDLSKHFSAGQNLHIIPKHLWPVPLNLLKDLDLAAWTPTPTLDRCLMVKTPDGDQPYFITPSGYPNSGGNAVNQSQ